MITFLFIATDKVECLTHVVCAQPTTRWRMTAARYFSAAVTWLFTSAFFLSSSTGQNGQMTAGLSDYKDKLIWRRLPSRWSTAPRRRRESRTSLFEFSLDSILKQLVYRLSGCVSFLFITIRSTIGQINKHTSNTSTLCQPVYGSTRWYLLLDDTAGRESKSSTHTLKTPHTENTNENKTHPTQKTTEKKHNKTRTADVCDVMSQMRSRTRLRSVLDSDGWMDRWMVCFWYQAGATTEELLRSVSR